MNENVTHLLRFNHFSSCVTLNGSDLHSFVARFLTVRESGFVASFPNVIDPCASDLSISNELHHLSNFHVVPIFLQISRSEKPTCICD